MKSWGYLGVGILIGVGLSWAEAYRRTEVRANKEYEEQLQSHLRALRKVRKMEESEAPKQSEEDLVDNSSKHIVEDTVITVGGEAVIETPMATPDYIAEAGRYVDPVMNLNLESLEYIEDEDYHEEDGRTKEQIMIVMSSEGDAMFLQDGMVIDDWAEKIGSEILTDFYVKLPPGESRVLYIRNHRRDEDYEVFQEMP